MAKARKSNPPSSAPRPVAESSARARSSAARAATPAAPGADLLRMAALALICIAVWCTVYDRWSGENWSLPVEYGINPDASDVKGDFAGIRAAEDGHFFPGVFHFEPRLNAPYEANWNDFPFNEDFMLWTTGIAARIVGLYTAGNLYLLFVQVLAVLAFYYAARQMRCDWKWAAPAALFYGLAPYAFAHSLHHLDITSYWHMPLALLVCFWIANGNGLRFGSRHYRLALAFAAVTGFQNVYYTNAFIQLVGVSLIIQWRRGGWRNWRACLPALTIGAMAFGIFFLLVTRVFFYALLHGHATGAAVRNYSQMEYYGLKLIDLFIPFFTHRITLFADLGRRYYSLTALPAEVPPACYMGLAGIAAFLWLGALTIRNAISRPLRRIPLEAVQVLWLFFYAMVGGINAFAGVLGFQFFRSTTRFCIVILAIVLLFAIRRLTLISRRWPSPWPILAPLAIGLFGILEIIPTTAGEDIRYVSAYVDSDRTFAQEMESSLPKGGMVFQLPVDDFPETPLPGMSGYDHFRPYLYTKDLRFSFGTDKGRPREAWQHALVGLSPAGQIAALERYGFSGIYVNRLAYADKGESLLAQYKAAGRATVIESPLKDLYCVVLRPDPNPELPPPAPFFARGWYPEQDGANGQREHLANGPASVILTNPGDTPVDKYASFYVAAASPRNVTLQGDGAAQFWHVEQQHPARVTNLKLTLPPGESALSFTTDTPGTPQSSGGVITFDIVNFDLTDSPIPEQ
jgi:hypothetical protein